MVWCQERKGTGARRYHGHIQVGHVAHLGSSAVRKDVVHRTPVSHPGIALKVCRILPGRHHALTAVPVAFHQSVSQRAERKGRTRDRRQGQEAECAGFIPEE